MWPEHHQSVLMFIKVATQWRSGMGGREGLDYGPLLFLMNRLDLTQEKFDQMFDDIQVMEAAALQEMHRDD